MTRKGVGRKRVMLNLKKKKYAKKIRKSLAQELQEIELKKQKKMSPASVISNRNRFSAGVTQHPTGAKM